MVANDVSNQAIGFNSDNNAATVLWHDGEQILELASKASIARQIVHLIAHQTRKNDLRSVSHNPTLKPFLAGNTKAAAHQEGGFPEHIFRAYDIRGHAENELTDAVIESIAAAIGTIAEQRGERALIVGCDGRTSSPRIKAALIRAIIATGRDVIDIGMAPT